MLLYLHIYSTLHFWKTYIKNPASHVIVSAYRKVHLAYQQWLLKFCLFQQRKWKESPLPLKSTRNVYVYKVLIQRHTHPVSTKPTSGKSYPCPCYINKYHFKSYVFTLEHYWDFFWWTCPTLYRLKVEIQNIKLFSHFSSVSRQ